VTASHDSTPKSDDLRWLAAGLYLGGKGRGLIHEAAEILASQGIPLMPLKGVLLQQLVYGGSKRGTRLISDVDVLVPPARFAEAHALLRDAGFTEAHWEGGGWQVALRRPGEVLCLDLHQRLSRTARARLTAERLLAGASRDTSLFGVEVLVPRPTDLFAHLVLHASLHFLNRGQLHHGEDFVAVPAALQLEAATCAATLVQHGLERHTLLVLSLVPDGDLTPFLRDLRRTLGKSPRHAAATHLVRSLATRFPVGSWERRVAGLLLASSSSRALASALQDRWLLVRDLAQGITGR